MKPIVFMVMYSLVLALIGMEGVYSLMPFIPIPTTKQMFEDRTISPIINTPRIPTSCPTNFTYSRTFSKCYYLLDSFMNFVNGNNTCVVNYGARLVMPKTNDELLFVVQMFPPGERGVRLGVTYRTVNGTPDWYYFDDTPYSLCTFGLTTPYTSYPILSLFSNNCSQNWDGTNREYIICEATPV